MPLHRLPCAARMRNDPVIQTTYLLQSGTPSQEHHWLLVVRVVFSRPDPQPICLLHASPPQHGPMQTLDRPSSTKYHSVGLNSLKNLETMYVLTSHMIRSRNSLSIFTEERYLDATAVGETHAALLRNLGVLLLQRCGICIHKFSCLGPRRYRFTPILSSNRWALRCCFSRNATVRADAHPFAVFMSPR